MTRQDVDYYILYNGYRIVSDIYSMPWKTVIYTKSKNINVFSKEFVKRSGFHCGSGVVSEYSQLENSIRNGGQQPSSPPSDPDSVSYSKIESNSKSILIRGKPHLCEMATY